MKPTAPAIAAALALSLSTAAHAVHLDPGGRGQVLIYPYYTVNKQQQTLVSVTNTSSVAQALKVRFNEGYNGRMVRDFNVFLSPFDSWTGTIFALRDAGIDSDGAAIISTDTSCTAPLFSEDLTSLGGTPYIAFRDSAFMNPDDGGPYTIDRTREGYIEVYAMADVAAPLSAAITHGSNGSAPTGCADVRNPEYNNAALSTPTGGLMGSVSIIDVARGTYLSVRAEALAGFTSIMLFTPPDNILPHLNDVNDGVGPLARRATARIFDESGKAQVLTYPSTSPNSRKVDAVSAVFMADRVYNEYQIAANLGAASDWLLTLPTKPFYSDPQYTGGGAIAPFVREYDGSVAAPGTYSPVFFNPTFYSRDGQDGHCTVILGAMCGGWKFVLSYVTNVYAVQPRVPASQVRTESLVLGSRHTYTVVRPDGNGASPTQFPRESAGTLAVSLNSIWETHALQPSAEGKVLRGLPVIGFWASNIVNNNVSNGVLANYAAAVRHATSVKCINYPSAATPCN